MKAGLVIAAAATIGFLGSCSRPAELTKDESKKEAVPSSVNANNQLPEIAASNANTTNSSVGAAADALTDTSTMNRLAAIRKTGAATSPAELESAIDRSAISAPDNSVYTSTLTDIGRETRTFRSHPKLLKVEKLITPKESVLKVHLRDGRVLQLPGASIPNLATISANEIMMKAGIHSAPADAPGGRSAKSAKAGKE